MALSWKERKAALVMAGVNMSEIARDCGVSAQHVSEVVAGRRRSSRIEVAVSKAIGRPVSKVFPPAHQALAS